MIRVLSRGKTFACVLIFMPKDSVQIYRESRSFWSFAGSRCGVIWEHILVSSNNIRMWLQTLSGISVIYSANRKGPRILPCKTLDNTVLYDALAPLTMSLSTLWEDPISNLILCEQVTSEVRCQKP